MRSDPDPNLDLRRTRRDWLRSSAQASLALALGHSLASASDRTRVDGPYGPFKMGIQSYSLRNFKLPEALQKTKDLGLGYWESFSSHIPTDEAQASRNRSLAADYGVKVTGYGVIGFTKDHDANRKLFDFGKALGISYFSADPAADAFDSLDKCVAEYQIGIGIHNHGPGHKYARISAIMDAVKDHDKRIGCCIDTGHFLRSKEDPVEAAHVFKGRIYGVHLKDVKNTTEFVVLGKGDLRLSALLKELADQKYEQCLALEYEEKPEDPMADIEACLAAVRKALA
jgi:sugar phosphate isomerase/epimerase